jgi:hypothetical protein
MRETIDLSKERITIKDRTQRDQQLFFLFLVVCLFALLLLLSRSSSHRLLLLTSLVIGPHARSFFSFVHNNNLPIPNRRHLPVANVHRCRFPYGIHRTRRHMKPTCKSIIANTHARFVCLTSFTEI